MPPPYDPAPRRRGPYLISLDPADLEAQFASPSPDDDEPSEDFLDGLSWEADVAPYLDGLPAVEADIIELRRLGCTEANIGRIIEMTQAGVSYRLARAIQRLRHEGVMADYPTTADIERDLIGVLGPRCVDAIVAIHAFSNFSHGVEAKWHGTSRRYCFHAGLARLERLAALGVTTVGPTRPVTAGTATTCTPGGSEVRASCGPSDEHGRASCWTDLGMCQGRITPSGRGPTPQPCPLSIYIAMMKYLTRPEARHMRHAARTPPHARGRPLEGTLTWWADYGF